MGKKILVVDNNPVMLKFMINLLEKEGHEILTPEDGLGAFDILKTHTPDVIFTDLIMPNIDGEKLCRLVRGNPVLKDVYLVILSAIAAEQEVNFTVFGANTCIEKGPLNKMGRHILTALKQSGSKVLPSIPKPTIGLEDISPRQITRELLSIKRHFEVVLESMSEGILEITPEARILYANPTAIALINIPEDRLIASNFTDLFKEADLDRVKDQLKAFKTQGQGPVRDVSVKVLEKEISLSLLPVLDQGRKTIIAILNDVSERRKMEAQLLQAQKMEAIGTLAGGIAHDFNNLLMVIQGNVSLMLLEIDPSHSHYEMLKTIEKKVQSGSKLTHQLLGYARRGKAEVTPIDLNQLVKETSEAFGRARKHITVRCDLASDLFAISGDQGQIEQVLMNLMVNAADAMPYGGDLFFKTTSIPRREVKGRFSHSQSSDYVLLMVSDTGIGMDPKTMEQIFDPFFTTKEFGRGTGLGLASVYTIIRDHGGYIDVESEKGKGSTFKIYLPASSGEFESAENLTDRILTGTETILLVDDEEAVLNVGKKLLKTLGYHVYIAWDGQQAIKLFRRHSKAIGLVILDIVMPNMEGREVLARLREIDPNVKVLLSSGYAMGDKSVAVMEQQYHGFIQKPFDIKQLSRSIRAILDRQPGALSSGK